MKKVQILGISLCMAMAALSTGAQAKGCLTGAAAGGVGGHFLGHHAMLGAAAGCAGALQAASRNMPVLAPTRPRNARRRTCLA